jgi:ABC-type Zn uptake system ZnuABC Zn-binding protein ZnuA
VSGCPASLVQNQYSNCAALRAQLQQAILELDRLQQAMNSACAANPQSTQCISLTPRFNAAELQVESLRQRLMACRS